MLKPNAGKIICALEAACLAVAIGRTEELHRIGGESVRAVEAAVDDPWVLSVLCQVLPAHDNGPEAWVLHDVMIDILRRVRFVVGEETAWAETDVLHENHVERYRSVARIESLYLP